MTSAPPVAACGVTPGVARQNLTCRRRCRRRSMRGHRRSTQVRAAGSAVSAVLLLEPQPPAQGRRAIVGASFPARPDGDGPGHLDKEWQPGGSRVGYRGSWSGELQAGGASRVALAACRELAHDWSPTTPSVGMAAHRWKARTEAAVAGPKTPSMPCGVTPHWNAPRVRMVCRDRTTAPRAPWDSSGIGPPLGRAAQVRGPTRPSDGRPAPSW